jgi:hypothetical protein
VAHHGCAIPSVARRLSKLPVREREVPKLPNCHTAKPSPTHVSPIGPITVLQRGSRAVHQSLPVHLLAGFWGSFSRFLSNSALAGRVHSRLSSPRVLPVRSPHPSKTGPAISPPCGSRPGFLSLPTPRQVPFSDIVHSHLASIDSKGAASVILESVSRRRRLRLNFPFSRRQNHPPSFNHHLARAARPRTTRGTRPSSHTNSSHSLSPRALF